MYKTRTSRSVRYTIKMNTGLSILSPVTSGFSCKLFCFLGVQRESANDACLFWYQKQLRWKVRPHGLPISHAIPVVPERLVDWGPPEGPGCSSTHLTSQQPAVCFVPCFPFKREWKYLQTNSSGISSRILPESTPKEVESGRCELRMPGHRSGQEADERNSLCPSGHPRRVPHCRGPHRENLCFLPKGHKETGGGPSLLAASQEHAV